MTIKQILGLGNMGQFINEMTNEPGSIDRPVGGEAKTGEGRTVISDLGDFSVQNEIPSRVIETKTSTTAPYCSLYNSFRFEAIPVYNFFVEDEELNDDEPRGDRKLRDIPRYIHLKWRRAPNTDKPPIAKRYPPATKQIRNSSFGLGPAVRSSTRQGINFDTDNVRAFSTIRKSVSNGYIAPGTINAVVEMPLPNAGVRIKRATPKVDEQSFLEAQDTDGIPIHDLQSNINMRLNGTLGASIVSKSTTSKKTKSSKGSLFDGKFAVSRQLGLTTVKSTAASSPAISMKIKTANGNSPGAMSRRNDSEDVVDALIVQTADTRKYDDDSDFTEVSFVNPAITGLVSEKKIDLISSPDHAENAIGIAQFMPNLAVLADVKDDMRNEAQPPSFPAVQEDSGTEYVGYVIEKYKQVDDGVFDLIDEIEIPDVNATEFVDTEVLYGGVYRYRMRTILRWTRKGNINHGGYEHGNFVNEDFTSTKSLASHKSSYYQSEWNRKWQYSAVIDTVNPPPPDEFRTRTESHRKRVVVSWKLPDNSQKDIHYYRLFRKTQDDSGRDTSDWELLDIRFGASNVLYFDNDVDYGTRYVYAAQTVSKHSEFSLLSAQLAVKLNEQFRFEGEHPIRQVSEKGVRLDAAGVFETKPPRRVRPLIVAQDKFMLTSRVGVDKQPLIDRDYHVRFESLDTGQKKEIIVSMKYDNGVPVDETINEDRVVVQRDKPVMDERFIRDAVDGVSVGSSGRESDAAADRGRSPGKYVSSLLDTNPSGLK